MPPKHQLRYITALTTNQSEIIISYIISPYKYLLLQELIYYIYHPQLMKKTSAPKIKPTNTPKSPSVKQELQKATNNNLFALNPVKKQIVAKPQPKIQPKPIPPKVQAKPPAPVPKLSNNIPKAGLQQENLKMPNKPFLKTALSLLKPKDKEKQVAAVIVSFQNGGSYDNLFRTIEQQSLQGTQVLVYVGEASSLKHILDGMKEKEASQIVQDLLSNIKGVDPDCVVFNWECSSAYSSSKFTEGSKVVMEFLKLILDAGHMAMFSDFSLKALIKQWDDNLLGKNPFVKIGETQNHVTLKFNPATLKQCPSAQLQIVGDMAVGGMCNIHTLGQTILFSVNKASIDQANYKLDVLTINTTNVPKFDEQVLNIDEHKGSAGHVLITYPSGGMILTSMGHWIELMKIDTSEQKIFQLAKEQYGAEQAEKMAEEYQKLDVASKRKYVQAQSIKYVQSQAPCANMSKKAKKKM